MHRADDRETAAAPDAAPPSRLLDELSQLGSAIKQLFGAQMELVAAELGLARSAISWMLVAGLIATVVGVGFGLTLLGLIGFLLARWFGSWPWALAALAGLQLLLLFGAIWLFRRCMHWMSMPASRQGWRTMMRETVRRAEHEVGRETTDGQGGDPA